MSTWHQLDFQQSTEAQVSMVERVQSNPFVAGNITVAPRDRQGEGEAEVQEMDEHVGWWLINDDCWNWLTIMSQQMQ